MYSTEHHLRSIMYIYRGLLGTPYMMYAGVDNNTWTRLPFLHAGQRR